VQKCRKNLNKEPRLSYIATKSKVSDYWPMNIQISKNRNISLLILASIVAISASLITAPMVTVGVGAAHPQKPKTPKDPKCNNVKILLSFKDSKRIQNSDSTGNTRW
jgi:hypothetical protein